MPSQFVKKFQQTGAKGQQPSINFALTAADYARHRAGFPDSLFERLQAFEIGRAGQRVLDLGAGTGSLGRGFARAGCRVVGLDLGWALLQQARQLDAQAGLSSAYLVGRAEQPPLAAGRFDLVGAGQCWHWFDRPAAARQVFRLLHPGGQALIAHFDWLPLPGSVVAATEALILQHNPAWNMAGGVGIYPLWPGDLSAAGFVDVETFSYDEAAAYTPAAWRGRIRASAGVGASLLPAAVERFDADLAQLLAEQFPGDLLQVPHRVFAVIASKPV